MNRLFWLVAAPVVLVVSCSRPVAKFTYEGELKAPAEVDFSNQSEKAETYLWDFGDGNQSSAPAPSHRYRSSGNYLVRLEARKDNKVGVREERIQIKAPQVCLVEIQTNYGTMLARLYDATPRHRDNFIELAEKEYFDSLLFHRVIRGFMVQGGDPESRNAGPNARLGGGGPGYRVPAEFVDSLVHVKGALAAARQGDAVNPLKESSGSQFYIVQGRPVTEAELSKVEAAKDIRYTQAQRKAYQEEGGTPFLDREYTVFGQVIEGLDVLDKIAATPTRPGDRPVSDVWMKVRVIK